jgi:hypothetical protein
MKNNDPFADLKAFAPEPSVPISGPKCPPVSRQSLKSIFKQIDCIANMGRRQILGSVGRGWEAVVDAARGARIEALYVPFFVAPHVARRWGLDRRQLAKTLDALEAAGLITTVERKRGRYRRIRLVINAAH